MVCMFAPQISLVLITPTHGGVATDQAELTGVMGNTARFIS